MKSKVGITGAAGHIGKLLQKGLAENYELKLFDIKTPTRTEFPFYQVDIADRKTLEGKFEGLNSLIHLAADPSPEAPWESVLKNNIEGTYNIFEESRLAEVKKIVFASTNHTQQGCVRKGESTVSLDTNFYKKGILLKPEDICPNSFYAVSKLFGENLGKMYSDRYRMQIISLRIGSTIPEDDPSALKEIGDYMKAMFISQRDCVDVFMRALEVELGKEKFFLGYAIGNNKKAIFDLIETREVLEFNPKDRAEDYFLK